jgi:hypothetical protein
VPWRHGDLILLSALATIGFWTIVAAWVGASGSTKVSTETIWLGAAIVAAVVAGFGNGLWLLAAHRAVRLRQRALTELALTMLPPDPAGSRAVQEIEVPVAAVTFPSASELVSAPRMTHFHRPDCQLVAGKPVTARPERQHRRAGRTPCRICRPLEEA